MLFFKSSDKQRSADAEDLQPASSPAVELHKDASGDVATAATVTADLPVDSAEKALATTTTAQVIAEELATILARLASLEQTITQLQQANIQLQQANTQLQQEQQHAIAGENAIKHACHQQIVEMEFKVDFLDQQVHQ